MTCTDPRFAEELGAWVLGACGPAEADAMREHLAACASCREQEARLRPARDALLAAPRPVMPSAAVKAAVMRDVRREAQLLGAARAPDRAHPTSARSAGRRGPRWTSLVPRPALALACSLLLAGAVGAMVVGGAPFDRPTAVVAEVDPALAPRGSARVEVRGGRARLEADGLPAPGRGRAYQVWVRSGQGAPRPTTARFTVDALGSATVEVPGDADGFDQVLVTSEPAAGSQRPTCAPVLQATV